MRRRLGPPVTLQLPVEFTAPGRAAGDDRQNAVWNGCEGITLEMRPAREIPGVLLQGKLSSPAAMAWQLHQHWPASRFVPINDEGHGGPHMVHAMIDAVTQFLPPLA